MVIVPCKVTLTYMVIVPCMVIIWYSTLTFPLLLDVLFITSLNPQYLRNIIKKVAKISIIQILMSNLSVKTTVFCSFLDIPQILLVYASSR